MSLQVREGSSDLSLNKRRIQVHIGNMRLFHQAYQRFFDENFDGARSSREVLGIFRPNGAAFEELAHCSIEAFGLNGD